MTLRHCSSCRHFYNDEFDLSLVAYSQNYETALHYSDVFVEYSEQLTRTLVDDWGVRNKRILEVGCGRGAFLNKLCVYGDNAGLGYDTSYEPGHGSGDLSPSVEIRSDYFEADAKIDPVDLLVCQQVLEHVPQPREFLASLLANSAVGDNGALLYLEVPNGLYTFENGGVWDLIYEHVSYFTLESFTRLVGSCGCEILDSGEAYGGQYLYLVARAGVARESLPELGCDDESYGFVEQFEDELSETIARWKKLISNSDGDPTRTFVWGAGSKGITFCNVVDPQAKMGGLIDRHPNKDGKFAANTGHKISSLSSLAPGSIERVIVMNSLYVDEISADLKNHGDVQILVV